MEIDVTKPNWKLFLLTAALLTAALLATACSGPADDAGTAGGEKRPVVPPTAVPRAEGSPLVPFPATGDLHVLDMGCDCVLSISPEGEIAIAVTKDDILGVTGASDIAFVDSAIAFDADGAMYFSESISGSILRRTKGGKLEQLVANETIATTTGAAVGDPEGFAFGADGMLYVVDDEAGVILKVDPGNGDVSVGFDIETLVADPEIEAVEVDTGIVGSDGVTVFVASQGVPQGILSVGDDGAKVVASGNSFGQLESYMTRAANGDVLVADHARDLIRRVTPAGEISTFLNESVLERVLGVDAKLAGGIALDSDGNFYLVEDHEDVVLRFDPALDGKIWISMRRIREVTGVRPDLDSGIAFAPR